MAGEHPFGGESPLLDIVKKNVIYIIARQQLSGY
jgi:hypothetical protein